MAGGLRLASGDMHIVFLHLSHIESMFAYSEFGCTYFGYFGIELEDFAYRNSDEIFPRILLQADIAYSEMAIYTFTLITNFKIWKNYLLSL